jgi:hypothetical protein
MKSFTIKKQWWILAVLVVMAVVLAVKLEMKKTMPEAVKECVRGGCSGQLCVEAGGDEGISTCEWKDEYQCYQKAKCVRQLNGKCGFTQDTELQQCLSKFGKGIDNSTRKPQ